MGVPNYRHDGLCNFFLSASSLDSNLDRYVLVIELRGLFSVQFQYLCTCGKLKRGLTFQQEIFSALKTSILS